MGVSVVVLQRTAAITAPHSALLLQWFGRVHGDVSGVPDRPCCCRPTLITKGKTSINKQVMKLLEGNLLKDKCRVNVQEKVLPIDCPRRPGNTLWPHSGIGCQFRSQQSQVMIVRALKPMRAGVRLSADLTNGSLPCVKFGMLPQGNKCT